MLHEKERICPDCGCNRLIPDGGCFYCSQCGFSSCIRSQIVTSDSRFRIRENAISGDKEALPQTKTLQKGERGHEQKKQNSRDRSKRGIP